MQMRQAIFVGSSIVTKTRKSRKKKKEEEE